MGLTTDLTRGEERPYFLWDEEMSVRELRETLHGQDGTERLRLLAKLLREARDDEVWQLVTPREVAAALPRVARMLGRRRTFWEYLIAGWREDGLVD